MNTNLEKAKVSPWSQQFRAAGTLCNYLHLLRTMPPLREGKEFVSPWQFVFLRGTLAQHSIGVLS